MTADKPLGQLRSELMEGFVLWEKRDGLWSLDYWSTLTGEKHRKVGTRAELMMFIYRTPYIQGSPLRGGVL